MPETLGFIGLGHMGLPMAENLIAGGFALRVYNRSPEKARPLAEKGATVVRAPHEVAIRGGIVVSMVADDRALDDVATDDLARNLGPGGVHISMSTVSPRTNERIAERHARHGASTIAAPVFGRPEAAAARKLWICESGPASAKQRAKPVLDALGQGSFDFGEAVGAANVVKLAGNFLLTAAIEGMAEVGALAEKNGIPRAAILNMLTSTLFNCPIYNGYSKRLIDADFDKVGFPMLLALKDMKLAQETASSSRVPMPVLSLLCDRFLSQIANGRGNLDASGIALGAADDAGLSW
jgi:3-hydroxyisobutyrate dehydrogenase-like beta-hydroxyacid dehydrogenase